MLWTAQGAFITANTTTANRGAYSGIFWCVSTLDPFQTAFSPEQAALAPPRWFAPAHRLSKRRALLQNSLLIGNLFGYFALPDSKISRA